MNKKCFLPLFVILFFFCFKSDLFAAEAIPRRSFTLDPATSVMLQPFLKLKFNSEAEAFNSFFSMHQFALSFVTIINQAFSFEEAQKIVSEMRHEILRVPEETGGIVKSVRSKVSDILKVARVSFFEGESKDSWYQGKVLEILLTLSTGLIKIMNIVKSSREPIPQTEVFMLTHLPLFLLIAQNTSTAVMEKPNKYLGQHTTLMSVLEEIKSIF
jgi:hypothetical protein